jgi:hypothetical protein
MKHLAIFSFFLLVLMVAQGCTSNDRTPAGLEGSSSTPVSAPATASRNHTQATGQADPASNGGSSLPASAPYQGSGAPVSQNVNPAPFLTASQPQGQAPGAAANTAPSETLTSRADGTMRGPNDLPAASTGWGSTAQPASSGKATKEQPRPQR